jgi:hypothetical protein
MSIESLLAKYEAELVQVKIDQRTDDALNQDAYRDRVYTLERIIADLQTEHVEARKPATAEAIRMFLNRIEVYPNNIEESYIGPYETLTIELDRQRLTFTLRDDVFQYVEIGQKS